MLIFPINTETTVPKSSIPHFLLLFVLIQQCTISSSLQTNILVLDAKNTPDNSGVQLTAPTPQSSSTGLVIWNKPIFSKLSFSTDFTFSISPHDGDGLAFIIFRTNPFRFSRNATFGIPKGVEFFGVEFHTLDDQNGGDIKGKGNHVGIDVNSLRSLEICDLSKTGLVLKSGMKMVSWINYDSSSKRLEVRLGKFGSARPYDPLIAYQVDLGGMWSDEMVSMGLSSSSGKSLQSVIVYSWNVRTWGIPKSLHSLPLNPLASASAHEEVEMVEKKKKSCVLGILSGMIFVTGCGALAAFAVLSLWAIISSSNEAGIPVKSNVGGNFRYERVNVVVEDSSADIKKHGLN